MFPDLSAPVFNVIVQNPAMGAEELETAIAIPLEVALAGLPDVRRIRSTSQLGVAQVTIEFEPDADYYRSRQLVAERIAQAGAQLPPGTDPPLLSSLTGRLNEIFEFTLEAEPGAADLMTLRDLAEFEVQEPPARGAGRRGGRAARRLPAPVPGAARPRPHVRARRRRSTRSCTRSRARTRTPRAASSCRGRSSGPCARSARATSVEDLRGTVVAMRGATPVLLGDVADVREAPAVRRGIAHRLRGEVVSCRIVKQFGADTMAVAAGVRARDRRRSAPGSRPASSCASSTTSPSSWARRSAASGARCWWAPCSWWACCSRLLGDLRAALLVTLTIPLSIALAGIAARARRASGSTR